MLNFYLYYQIYYFSELIAKFLLCSWALIMLFMHIFMEGLLQYSTDGSEFEKELKNKAINRRFHCHRVKMLYNHSIKTW